MATSIPLVCLCAGLSSRFGGKIKQFAQVGPNGETLIEVSMNQAIQAGFNKIIFIVGNMTEQPFKQKFSNTYKGIPISYALQTYDPKKRDRPWGTIDAVVAAKDAIKGNFVVCTGDDIFGEAAFKEAHKFAARGAGEAAAIAYKLKNVMPKTGLINRGVITRVQGGYVEEITEITGIDVTNIGGKGLAPDSLCSMVFFCFPKNVLELLEERLNRFKEAHVNDRKIECYLPFELTALIREKKLAMKVLPTKGKWIGITNPGDEEEVRKALADN